MGDQVSTSWQEECSNRTSLTSTNYHDLSDLSNKNARSFWKPSLPLEMLPKNCSTSNYCDYDHNHNHSAEECQSLKSFVLKLIDEGNLKEYLTQHQQEAPLHLCDQECLRSLTTFVTSHDHRGNYLVHTRVLILLPNQCIVLFAMHFLYEICG